jgi:phosphoserine phosphatase
MTDTHIIALQPPFYAAEFSDFDSLSVMTTLLAGANVGMFELRHDEAVWQVLSTFPDACAAAFTAVCTTSTGKPVNDESQSLEAPVAQLTIAAQSLTIRRLAQVLSALFPTGSQVFIQLNAHGPAFAIAAVDVFCVKNATADKAKLHEICVQYRLDVFQKGAASLDSPGLLVMDMDSTVIAMECIDEIAALAGLKDSVSAVTERAMQGQIAFTQSLHERVACLEGVAESALLLIRDQLPFMPGFMQTMRILKKANWRLALASGGFTFFADYVKKIADLDAAFSNQLDIDKGMLSGKVLGKVVDAEEKARILLDLASSYHITKSQTVAVGDGANDLIMMDEAGLSIAFHAKPAVSQAADVAIRYCGFEGVLFSLK